MALPSLANKVADYALCMAGPTGAISLNDDSARFRRLVRRRLVAATATDRPFARCATLAREISGRADVGESHQQPAGDFIEWGGGGGKLSENELFTVLPDLEAMHRRGWPLVRKPLSEMLRPSRGAFEAVHAMDLATPTAISGLVLEGSILRSSVDTPKGRYLVLSNERETWAYRSRDQGHHWTVTSAWQAAVDGHAHHCVAGVAGLSFGLEPSRGDTGPALLIGNIASIGGERREFGSPTDTVKRLACDDSGAVLLTQARGQGAYRVFTCPVGGRCREVALPPQAQQKNVVLDVARVAKTVVVVMAKDGLVRASISRDEGATLSPLSLVFDGRDNKLTGLESGLTVNLVGFGSQVQLMLSPAKGGSRWALVSDDRGASFRSL